MNNTGHSEANLPNKRFGGFFEAQKLTIEDVKPGEVIVRLVDPRDDQRGGGGNASLNGGVIAYMFDGALGAAVTSLVTRELGIDVHDRANFGEATISLTINYVQPAFGEVFEARGLALRTGRTIAFAEGKLFDEQGQICATASGVWRLFIKK